MNHFLQSILNISCNNEQLLNTWLKDFSVNSEIINFSLINYKCSIYNNGNYTVLPISSRLRYFNWTSALPVGSKYSYRKVGG